jgi:hypothetical protein
MFLVSILRYALSLLVPVSLIATTYLYYYPVFSRCAFPSPEGDASASYLNTFRQHLSSPVYNASLIAPFRLLALGDPQLEGDTSIHPNAATFPNLAKFWEDALLLNGKEHSILGRIRYSLHDLVEFYFDDIPKTLDSYRKRVDLIGNDYYLAHIYRTLHWWAKPTHVSVLGDLVGSQWIDDGEFNIRGNRFWNRVFRQGQRVSDELTAEHENWDHAPQLGDDAEAWSKRVINIAGNHDIGYAGDLTAERFERFERVFGRANYELRFHLPQPSFNSTSSPEREVPELRIVVLNDMNLDTPAISKDLQDATYKFLNDLITSSHVVTRPALFTLLLTHIPLHKKSGICVDEPFFSFHDTEIFAFGVKEQNHLSRDASASILEGLFGLSGNSFVDGAGRGRNGLILTGHDHEGCDVYHYINQSTPEEARRWEATRTPDAASMGITDEPGIPSLREITVRSMMGEFGGNAGLLSLWFDPETWEWKFDFSTCSLGVQHWWWAVHIVDLITICVVIAFAALKLFNTFVVSASTKRVYGTWSIKVEKPVDKGKPNAWHANGDKEWQYRKQKWDDVLDASGREQFPQLQSGKRSLRKKKSKRALNGSPATPELSSRPGTSTPSIARAGAAPERAAEALTAVFGTPSSRHER